MGPANNSGLEQQVREALHEVYANADSLDIAIEDDRVTLRGNVLVEDADRLIERVRQVPGVTNVINQLNTLQSTNY
jgi:osmotically-inducible protein OsmY